MKSLRTSQSLPEARAGLASAELRLSFSFWYLVVIALLTARIAVLRVLHPNGWTPGDWLINYNGGFVRRGLSGELILLASRGLHLTPVLLGSLLPLGFYGLIYYAVWRLYSRSHRGLWQIAALLSPATLAFPILDATGSFRKETIFLAGLGLLLVYLDREKVHDGVLSAYLAGVGAFSILCHEATLPYLVYFVGALLIATHDPRRVLRVVFLPLLGVAAALFAVLQHRGNAAIEQTICRSLGAVPPIVCSGAIAYLANGSEIARADVVRYIHVDHYFFYFPLLTALALIPLLAGVVRLTRRPGAQFDVSVLAATTIAACAGTVPLFLYALDWGRWIYIHVFSLFLLLLFMDARLPVTRPERAHEGASSTPAPERWFTVARRRPWIVLGLVLYVTCWNLPHYGNYPKKGYLNTPLHLLKRKLDQRAGLPTSPEPE